MIVLSDSDSNDMFMSLRRIQILVVDVGSMNVGHIYVRPADDVFRRDNTFGSPFDISLVISNHVDDDGGGDSPVYVGLIVFDVGNGGAIEMGPAMEGRLRSTLRHIFERSNNLGDPLVPN